MSSTRRKEWGGWRYDYEEGKIATLTYAPAADYWIPVGSIKTAHEILDWIVQVSQKNWANSDVLAGLVHALDDVLNIQANFCPSGQEPP